MLTNLADVCRTSGLTVEEVPGWAGRGHGSMKAVRGVVLHHTAGSATGDYPSLGTVRDGRAGLAGPLAQLGLARSGKVLVIAAGVAYHAGKGSGFGLPKDGANSYMLGIEAESTGQGDWTQAQIDAYPRLAAALARGYGFDAGMCIGHKEWAPGRKIDPAGWPGDMAGFRASVAAILGGATPVVNPVTPSAPAADTRARNADGSLTIAVDGVRGAATIARWQEVMGTPIDGVLSKPSTVIRADQAMLNAVIPAANLRDLAGGALAVDGLEGAKTIRARQFWLFNRFGPQVLGRAPTVGDFDGIAGPNTTKLHQAALNAATARSGRY